MSLLKAGTRLRSAVCSSEVMVVAAPKEEVEISCGGAPLIALDAEPPAGGSLSPEASGGSQIGKRYVSEAGDLELLCTKPGQGLTVKGAKPLPSSD